MRLHILSVTALFVALSACGGGGGGSDDSNGGKFGLCNAIGLKIANGDECSSSGSPVARITLLDGSGTSLALCSGTLITSTKVLTAAHCFRLFAAASAEVEIEGRSYAASDFQVNPLFQAVFGNNFDTAVITLSSSPPVPPVPIIVTTSAKPGIEVGVYGYGETESGDSGASFHAAGMKVRTVSSGGFSADFDSTQASVCPGDSGGPAIGSAQGQNGVLGITSFGVNANESGDEVSCLSGSTAFFVDPAIAGNLRFISAAAPGIGTL